MPVVAKGVLNTALCAFTHCGVYVAIVGPLITGAMNGVSTSLKHARPFTSDLVRLLYEFHCALQESALK